MLDDKETEATADASLNNEPVQVEIIPETPEVKEPKLEENPQFKGLLRRIDTLTRKRHEAEEREAAKDQFIQRLAFELNEAKKTSSVAEKSSVEVISGNLQSQIDMAKKAFTTAYDVGDKDAMVAAQEAMAEAKANLAVLSMRKLQEEDQPRPQPRVAPQQPQRQQYNNKAVSWARSKEWWNVNRAATGAAYGIDQDLTEEGWDPASDDYYEEIDRRMKEQFPRLYKEESDEDRDEPVRPKPRQTVSSQSPRQQVQQNGLTVRLTQDEMRTAQRLGVSAKDYAAQKAKIQTDGGSMYAEIN